MSSMGNHYMINQPNLYPTIANDRDLASPTPSAIPGQYPGSHHSQLPGRPHSCPQDNWVPQDNNPHYANDPPQSIDTHDLQSINHEEDQSAKDEREKQYIIRHYDDKTFEPSKESNEMVRRYCGFVFMSYTSYIEDNLATSQTISNRFRQDFTRFTRMDFHKCGSIAYKSMRD